MGKVRVKCTVYVEVDIDVENPQFHIEENGCPGTGVVGAEITKTIEECDKQGYCWACNLEGTNEIVGWLK